MKLYCSLPCMQPPRPLPLPVAHGVFEDAILSGVSLLLPSLDPPLAVGPYLASSMPLASIIVTSQTAVGSS